MIFSKEVGESLTYRFAQAANEMKAQGKEIISLGLGEPDFKTPYYIIEAVTNALNEGFTHYSATQGLPELRQLIAGDVNSVHNSAYTKEEVIVLPGIKAAVYFALCALLEPGDEVILISPYYVSYPAMVKLAEPNAVITTVSLGKDFSLDMDNLKAAFSSRTKCILINNPNNPTGKVLTCREVYEISQLAKQNHSYIIADEVYEKLTYTGVPFTSFGSISDNRDNLIICNGYSKSYAMTGWRLGYAIGPADIIKRMNKLQQHINTNTCTFIQKAACEIYHHSPDHLRPYVDDLENRIAYFDYYINAMSCMSGRKPQAGFFYFVDISKTGLDSNSFCADLLKKTGIASTPGIAFGPEWDSFVRFSFAVPMSTLERAVGLMNTYFSNGKE